MTIFKPAKMDYKSIIPTNAPSFAKAPESLSYVRPFANDKNDEYVPYGSKTKKFVQAASCLVEKPSLVVHGEFTNNGFMSAVHAAFAQHLPLLIIPDDIWHIFLSQVSIIVNKDPERYRESFVDHRDKELIEVRNDELVMDVVDPIRTALWQTVFPVFEQKMNEKMKININREFSTTTRTHYTVSQILVMDSMKNYFNYKVTTKCGIPEIRIGGTRIDWEMLDAAVQEVCSKIFEQPGSSNNKSPNYTNFISECKKVLDLKGDPTFWEKLYHFKGAKGSGQTNKVTGIVNDLFPFDTECKRAPGSGILREVSSFPSVFGKVPFMWEYFGTNNNCEFEAGLTHAGWDPVAKHLYSKPTWKINRIIN